MTPTLTEQLERLALYEPAPYPVVSLYLNTQPGQHGRDQHQGFIRKEFKARGRTYPANSPERESLERDLDRITRFLENHLEPSANGVAIFACSSCDLFEAIQLGAPIERDWMFIGDRPHLYPLARVESQYPRYAVLLVDTNSARILVFAAGELVAQSEVNGVKTRRSQQGGWSQNRFQRHVSNFHLHHTKEVVDALDRIVHQESINQIVVAGDEVITPLLREQLPKHLAEKVIDQVRIDMHAPLHDVLRVTLDAMRKANERTDRETVDAAIGAYRAGGLGVVGPEDTLAALVKGQVDELLLSASMGNLKGVPSGNGAAQAQEGALADPAITPVIAGASENAHPNVVRLADELVTKAKQTGARITFVEDPALLRDYGGVAALLRFRI